MASKKYSSNVKCIWHIFAHLYAYLYADQYHRDPDKMFIYLVEISVLAVRTKGVIQPIDLKEK